MSNSQTIAFSEINMEVCKGPKTSLVSKMFVFGEGDV